MKTISKWLTALALLLPMVANADLIPADGGALVNDTTGNLTWVSDANLMATQASSYGGGASAYVSALIAASGGAIHDTPNPFDTPVNSGIYNLSAADFDTSHGQMTWWGAQAWVHYLDVMNNGHGYQGYTDWRLPTTEDDINFSFGPPPPVSSSEMAELFYGQLGQVFSQSITTTNNGSAGYNLFSNVVSHPYWSGTEHSPTIYAWYLSAFDGSQSADFKSLSDNALAVRGGLAPVPLPAAAWLLLNGLGGLGVMVCRRTG